MKLTLTTEQWNEAINYYRCAKIVDGVKFICVRSEGAENLLVPIKIVAGQRSVRAKKIRIGGTARSRGENNER